MKLNHSKLTLNWPFINGRMIQLKRESKTIITYLNRHYLNISLIRPLGRVLMGVKLTHLPNHFIR